MQSGKFTMPNIQNPKKEVTGQLVQSHTVAREKYINQLMFDQILETLSNPLYI